MAALINLTAQREGEAFVPTTPPKMIKLIAIDALPVLRLLGSSDGKLEILRSDLGGRGHEPFSDQP
jgi:hypothetical protein